MFTGIIIEKGVITDLRPGPEDSMVLRVEASQSLVGVQRSDSIAVSGVCLTVTDFDDTHFSADVMAQTMKLTSLGAKQVGDEVNLEPAMVASTRFGGHIVQGHVEATARVLTIEEAKKWQVIRFDLPTHLAPLLVDQGSICVDGVSLTVATVSAPEAEEHYFDVSLIPETLQATTLGQLEIGDTVNIETDILARHVARMLNFHSIQK